jgi:hypothetical protein
MSSVIDTLLNIKPLFIFDKKKFCCSPLQSVNKYLINDSNTAWDLHYFKTDFDNDVNQVSDMYNRRLTRLILKLKSDDNKIFIRMMHTLDSYHPEINGNKEKDDVKEWINFYDICSVKYKNCKLILINNELDTYKLEHIKKGVLYVNDKEVFENTYGKLVNFLKNINYNDI